MEETDIAGGRFVRRTLSGAITVALFVASLGLLFAAYAQLALPLVAPPPPLRSLVAVPAPPIAVRTAPRVPLRVALRPPPSVSDRPRKPVALPPAHPAAAFRPAHPAVAFRPAHPAVAFRPAHPTAARAPAHRRAVAVRRDEMPEPPIGFVLRPALALVSDAEPVEPSVDMVLVLRPPRHRR